MVLAILSYIYHTTHHQHAAQIIDIANSGNLELKLRLGLNWFSPSQTLMPHHGRHTPFKLYQDLHLCTLDLIIVHGYF